MISKRTACCLPFLLIWLICFQTNKIVASGGEQSTGQEQFGTVATLPTGSAAEDLAADAGSGPLVANPVTPDAGNQTQLGLGIGLGVGLGVLLIALAIWKYKKVQKKDQNRAKNKINEFNGKAKQLSALSGQFQELDPKEQAELIARIDDFNERVQKVDQVYDPKERAKLDAEVAIAYVKTVDKLQEFASKLQFDGEAKKAFDGVLGTLNTEVAEVKKTFPFLKELDKAKSGARKFAEGWVPLVSERPEYDQLAKGIDAAVAVRVLQPEGKALEERGVGTPPAEGEIDDSESVAGSEAESVNGRDAGDLQQEDIPEPLDADVVKDEKPAEHEAKADADGKAVMPSEEKITAAKLEEHNRILTSRGARQEPSAEEVAALEKQAAAEPIATGEHVAVVEKPPASPRAKEQAHSTDAAAAPATAKLAKVTGHTGPAGKPTGTSMLPGIHVEAQSYSNVAFHGTLPPPHALPSHPPSPRPPASPHHPVAP